MDQNDRLNFTYLDKIIEKGDVLVDIGANQGIYTDFFKRLINDDGKIYTVELHPQTFKILVGKYTGSGQLIGSRMLRPRPRNSYNISSG